MSITNTHVPVAEIAADPSAPPADSREVTGRYADDAFVQGDLAAVEQLIADVLGRAHQTAEALDEPNEARAILEVVHSFADQLAAMNPHFDRMRFIHAATTDPS
jgi:hypothetical protein